MTSKLTELQPHNILALGGANIVASFSLSIRLSLLSALMGTLAGLVLGLTPVRRLLVWVEGKIRA